MSLRASVVLAFNLTLGAVPSATLAAGTLPFFMANGGRSDNLELAAESWRNDSEFNGNWGLNTIRAEYPYAQGLSGLGAKIGIIDQPVWSEHPEFADAKDGERKLTFIVTRGIRTYDDPYLPFRAGQPFVYDGQIYVDGRGEVATHGTHVAGIAAANRDSRGSTTGVMQGAAFDARIFAADNGDPGPEDGIVRGNDGGTYFAAWKAMIDNQVNVITNSWGIGITTAVNWDLAWAGKQFLEIRSLLGTPEGGAYDGALLAARSGIVVEFSAGNDSGRHPDAMAGLPTFVPDIENNWLITMSLARSDDTLSISNFSSICGYAKYYCVGAPGSEINSAIVNAEVSGQQPGDQVNNAVADYALLSGTSMAGPFVSGSIGLLNQRFPYLANGDVAQILKTTATDLGEPGVDEEYGWGLINLQKAMNGPGQLLTRMTVDIPAGGRDVWSNDIGDAALRQRKNEALAAIAAWEQRKISNGWQQGWANVDAATTITRLYTEYRPQVAMARMLVRNLLAARAIPPHTGFADAFLAVENDPVASALVAEFGKETHWLELGPDPVVFDQFIAARYPDDEALASALAERAFNHQALEFAAMQMVTANLSQQSYENGLIKKGGGELWLTGHNTYRGETRVEAGRLAVEGSLAGAVVAYGQGVLGGNGRIGSLIVRNGGTVAPGNSIGTLTVGGREVAADGVGDGVEEPTQTGTARFEAGSRLAIEIDAQGHSDRLVVTGKAQLLGGEVRVLAEDGVPPLETFVAAAEAGHKYIVLTAGEGIEGRFDSTRSPYAFFRPTLAQSADSVSLGIQRLPFATGGRNENERQTASGIDSLVSSHHLHQQVLAFPNGFASGDFFAAVSGDLHPTIGGMLLSDSHFLRDAAIARLHGDGLSAPTSGSRAWGQVHRVWTRADSDGNAAGYDRNLNGFFLGGETRIGARATIGFLGGYGDGSVTSSRTSAETDSYWMGIYGGGYRGALGLRFGAGFGHHALKTERNLPIGRAIAGYDADDWQLFTEIGRAFEQENSQIEPYFGLAYAGSKSADFTEKDGGVYHLSGTVERAELVTGTLGLRLAHTRHWGATKTQFFGAMAWKQMAGNTTPTARLAFEGGDRFDNLGLPIARHTLALTANLNIALTPMTTFRLFYAGQLARDLREHELSASLGINF